MDKTVANIRDLAAWHATYQFMSGEDLAAWRHITWWEGPDR